MSCEHCECTCDQIIRVGPSYLDHPLARGKSGARNEEATIIDMTRNDPSDLSGLPVYLGE